MLSESALLNRHLGVVLEVMSPVHLLECRIVERSYLVTVGFVLTISFSATQEVFIVSNIARISCIVDWILGASNDYPLPL